MSAFPDLLSSMGEQFSTIRGALRANAPLGGLTWLRVGGNAQLLFQPADIEDLQTFLEILPQEIPVTILGLGSNLLIRDGGIEGAVIRLSMRGFGFIKQENQAKIRVGASVLDKRAAEAARDHGIGGLAFLYGIPGSIGGALRMNAGTRDGEMADCLQSARAVTREGKLIELDLTEFGYSYRHSQIPDDIIFVDAILHGELRDQELIESEMLEVRQHRETAQPIREKTGGSTFKNPEGHSAWQLIDSAGGRGFTIGDAQMSTMHCNFMINCGNASALDLETLAETMRNKVREKSGIELEWEIRRLGRFGEAGQVTPFMEAIA